MVVAAAAAAAAVVDGDNNKKKRKNYFYNQNVNFNPHVQQQFCSIKRSHFAHNS